MVVLQCGRWLVPAALAGILGLGLQVAVEMKDAPRVNSRIGMAARGRQLAEALSLCQSVCVGLRDCVIPTTHLLGDGQQLLTGLGGVEHLCTSCAMRTCAAHAGQTQGQASGENRQHNMSKCVSSWINSLSNVSSARWHCAAHKKHLHDILSRHER